VRYQAIEEENIGTSRARYCRGVAVLEVVAALRLLWRNKCGCLDDRSAIGHRRRRPLIGDGSIVLAREVQSFIDGVEYPFPLVVVPPVQSELWSCLGLSSPGACAASLELSKRVAVHPEKKSR
jgi:hypothetical protein